MNHRPIITIFCALAALSLSAQAHHGRDFLVVEDYTLPAPWSGNLFTNFDWERRSGDDEFALEGGFFLGVAPRVGVETTVGFLDEGDGWEYGSVDPALFVQLTPPTSSFPIRVSVSAGYQFGGLDDDDSGLDADEEAGHGHDDDDHGDHDHELEEHDHDSDAEEDGHDHEHLGIHRHGENYFHSRLILETDFTPSLKGAFNLIAVVPDSGGAAWGYSAGLRYSFNHAVAAGLEAIGDFQSHGEHELILGTYFSPVHSVSLKLGAGFGLTEESPDFALHTGLIWRF